MYDVRGGQSSIQAKRTPRVRFFLPSYINFTSYIVPSYINFTSYMVPSYFFCRFFSFFLHICKKKCTFVPDLAVCDTNGIIYIIRKKQN